MNYPAIKDGDKVSFTQFASSIRNKREVTLEDGVTINIVRGGIMTDFTGASVLGFQDNPQLMENGITNFRIHERADGTPVFMEGDMVLNKFGHEYVVLAVNNDTFLPSYPKRLSNVNMPDNWMTFKWANELGWKLKEATEEDCNHDDLVDVFAYFLSATKEPKTYTKQEIVEEEAPEEECEHKWECSPGGMTWCLNGCHKIFIRPDIKEAPEEEEDEGWSDGTIPEYLDRIDKKYPVLNGQDITQGAPLKAPEEDEGISIPSGPTVNFGEDRYVRLDDGSVCKVAKKGETYTKQEIVDVLKGKLDILPNATEGAPYGFHQACIGIAKALGISDEELND